MTRSEITLAVVGAALAIGGRVAKGPAVQAPPPKHSAFQAPRKVGAPPGGVVKERGERVRVETVCKIILDRWLVTDKRPKRFAEVAKEFRRAEMREFGSHEGADYRWSWSPPKGRYVTLSVQEYVRGKPTSRNPFRWPVADASPRMVWEPRWLENPATGADRIWNRDLNLAHLPAQKLLSTVWENGSHKSYT